MVKPYLYYCYMTFGVFICAPHVIAATNQASPLYIGGSIGYGSTTWDGLVPTAANQNPATNIGTPIAAAEGGYVPGGFIGYEFSKHFALEGSYLAFKTATIFFATDSLFSFNHDGVTSFTSKTNTFNIMGKFMINIDHNTTRVFSSIGHAVLHRKDILLNKWRFTPTFGIGINHKMSEHFIIEITGIYTAGYGESRLEPT